MDWLMLLKILGAFGINKFYKSYKVSSTASLTTVFPFLEKRSWFWDICLNKFACQFKHFTQLKIIMYNLKINLQK